MTDRSRRNVLSLLATLLAISPADAGSLTFRRSSTLPKAAHRIVALEFVIAEILAKLDSPPIGMSDPKLYPGWIGVDVARLKATADVGTRQQPSLEAITALQPDLILGVAYRHAALFDVFETIAPTILLEFEPLPTETRLDSVFALLAMIGDLVGKAEKAGEVLTATDAAIARDAARIAADGRTGQRLVVLQELGGNDTYWTFTSDSLSAGLASRLGLRFWPPDRSREGVRPITSDELLGLDDAHVALVSLTGPSVTLADKTRSATWQRVPALKAGRVTLIRRNIWNFGGPGSAVRLSNVLTDTILKAPAAD